MAKIVNPALFIGLGGTGHKVLLQVKKAVLKNYGEVPPMIKLLCMDTDRRELHSSTEEIEYNKKKSDGTREIVNESLKFDPNETVAIPITNPQGLANQDYIRSWVNDSVLAQIGPSDSGARQIRQMGRFAIFENYSKQNVVGQIENRINELKNVVQLKNTEYSLGDNQAKPCIHLVFSPCGGTGAGTFIDVVTIIRKIDPQIEVFGYLVMPDFYTRFPMTMSVIQNAYASLIEIDHLMGQDATKDKNKSFSNYYKAPYEVDYSGNGTKLKLPGGSKGFFEYLYLFDNINEKGKFIESVDDMYDRIGRILFLMVSGPGTKMQSNYSNNKDYLFPTSEKTFSKRRNYSSMGISQIILDRNFLKDLKRNQIIRTILNAYSFSDNHLETSTLNTFIDANEWREDSGKDMVINKLFPKNQLKYSIDALYPRFKKGCHVELKPNVDNFLKMWEEKCVSNIKLVREQMLDDFHNKLDSEIKKYLKSKGGVSNCKQFLTFLSGAFLGMSDEMDKETKAHKSNREKLSKDVPIYIESIKNEEDSFSPFGREKRIKEASEAYVGNAERILFENWQIARKEAAKLFYDVSIEVIRGYQKQTHDLEQILIETSSDIERESQKIKNKSNNESDFERSIHYYYKELLNEKNDDINIEEAFRNVDFSKLLNLKSVTEIKNTLFQYIETTDALKGIDNLKIENILKSLDKDIMENIINYLDVSSSVCIDVDQSFLLTSDKAKMEKFGFICVESDENTVFDENGEFFNKLSTEGGYSKLNTFSTGDSDRITMIKIAGMFPGSAIKRVQNYKSRFETSSLYHFSDIYFEKNAMDLVDGVDDESESLLYFTIGSAIGKIYLHSAAIIIETEEGKKEPLYEGNRKKTIRAEAAKFFSKNKDYAAYIKNLLDKMEKEKGKQAVSDMLLNFYRNITTIPVLGKIFENMDKELEEYRNIFEEKAKLKEYILTLGMVKGNEF